MDFEAHPFKFNKVELNNTLEHPNSVFMFDEGVDAADEEASKKISLDDVYEKCKDELMPEPGLNFGI